MCTEINTNKSTELTQGLHHLGLTVPNVKEAAHFFIDMLNYSQVGAIEDYPAIFVSDGTTMLTLWQVKSQEEQKDFDHKNNIGLHHFALKVESKEAFELLNKKLISDGNVNIEFGPGEFGDAHQHMICEVLGGIRIEFVADSK